MYLGWDIGGVNTKIAAVRDGVVLAVRGRAFELQRDPHGLVALLRTLATEVGADDTSTHGVTMTAELSQMFRTKRDGVDFVITALERAFPVAATRQAIRVYTVDGAFVTCDAARRNPLSVAAANWTATASLVARRHRDAVLIDIGTTTTDIIPIAAGRVAAIGRTDPDRLASGELVYSGAVRTPVEAIVSAVPFGSGAASVSAEGFALVGDVHVWRGDLSPDDYTTTAPDGRPATSEFAAERLARVICADREMLDSNGISAIADAIAVAQVMHVTEAIRRVASRHPSLDTAIVTGLGAFIAARAARDARLRVVHLAEELGGDAGRCAPATAVALLLADRSRDADLPPVPKVARPTVRLGEAGTASARAFESEVEPPPAARATARSRALVVVKVGGALLRHPDTLEQTLAALGAAAAEAPMAIVPGGGMFADAVREVDAAIGLTSDAAHWMAILAMDQYAHVIASRLARGCIVRDPESLHAAHAAGDVPVLAPSQWLRARDPLPHSWDVTSDSIAAWVAAELGAHRLVVVKAPGATGTGVTDAYFERALRGEMNVAIVPADDAPRLQRALRLPLRAASIRFDATSR